MRYSRGKQCQILLTIFLGFFPCNLKNVLYNVDIREKKKRKKRENENGKHDCAEYGC
jgi:hypothetical protein